MSVSLYAKSRIEHVRLIYVTENTELIAKERELHKLDLILQSLAAQGYSSFEDLFLRNDKPFVIVAEAVDLYNSVRCVEQKEMNEIFDKVIAVLSTGYHVSRELGEKLRGAKDAILDVVYAKQAVDMSNPDCFVRNYWDRKGKRWQMKIELDGELNFKTTDLTPLADDGSADSNESVKVVKISEGVTEFHIRSEKSSYLPDP